MEGQSLRMYSLGRLAADLPVRAARRPRLRRPGQEIPKNVEPVPVPPTASHRHYC